MVKDGYCKCYKTSEIIFNLFLVDKSEPLHANMCTLVAKQFPGEFHGLRYPSDWPQRAVLTQFTSRLLVQISWWELESHKQICLS